MHTHRTFVSCLVLALAACDSEKASTASEMLLPATPVGVMPAARNAVGPYQPSGLTPRRNPVVRLSNDELKKLLEPKSDAGLEPYDPAVHL